MYLIHLYRVLFFFLTIIFFFFRVVRNDREMYAIRAWTVFEIFRFRVRRVNFYFQAPHSTSDRDIRRYGSSERLRIFHETTKKSEAEMLLRGTSAPSNDLLTANIRFDVGYSVLSIVRFESGGCCSKTKNKKYLKNPLDNLDSVSTNKSLSCRPQLCTHIWKQL